MADLDLGTDAQVTDKRLGRGTTGVDIMAEVANADNISLLKTRLTALSATSFTAARLATMTKNDMLYALRVHSADSAGI
jgi:hypothetical protein